MSQELKHKAPLGKIKTPGFVTTVLMLSVLFLVCGTGQPAAGQAAYVETLKHSNYAPAAAAAAQDEFLKEYQEARDLIAKEDWGKASEKLDKIIKQNPKHSLADAALYWLAFSYKKQNKFRETEETLQRLVQEFPSSAWVNDAMVMRLEISRKLGQEGVSKVLLPTLGNYKATLIDSVPLTYGKLESTTLYTDTIEFYVHEPLDDQSEIKLAALRSLYLSDQKKALDAAREALRPESKAGERLKENIIYLTERSAGVSAVPLMIEVATRETNSKVRRAAISALGGMDFEPAADFLSQLYDRETKPEDKRLVLLALSRHKRNASKLMEILKAETSVPLRQIAITRLGRFGGEPVIEFLAQTYDTESNSEIKSEILSALGNSRNKRAIKKLIDVARGDQSAQMKIKAINALGGSNDPDAIKFLEEIAR